MKRTDGRTDGRTGGLHSNFAFVLRALQKQFKNLLATHFARDKRIPKIHGPLLHTITLIINVYLAGTRFCAY